MGLRHHGQNEVGASNRGYQGMALKKLVLHIGMGKTGTTTIQTFLIRNAQLLRRQGVLAFMPGSLEPFKGFEFQELFERLREGLQQIMQHAKRARANSVIWSMEALGTRQFGEDVSRIKMICDELPARDVRVIVYLRRQDHFARSSYLQWGVLHKTYRGPVLSFEERFPSIVGEDGSRLSNTNFNYYEVIKPWADVFGADNVVVRPFEKNQWVEGDLLRDFVTRSAMPSLDYDLDIPRANKTFAMELYEMFRMYNSVFEEAIFPAEMSDFFHSFAADEFFQRPFFSHFSLPAKTRLEILESCKHFNARVAGEFLGRSDGVLFDEPWPSPDEPHCEGAELSMEKLVPILMQVLLKQHERIAHLESLAADSASPPT